MIKVIKAILITILFIFAVTFSMENSQPLVLRYYFGIATPPLPLFLLVLFSVLVGVLLAGLGFLVDQHILKKALREKERQIDALKRNVESHERSDTSAFG